MGQEPEEGSPENEPTGTGLGHDYSLRTRGLYK